MPDYAAIVLAGGAGRRLGRVDKATITIGDRTLLDRALEAVAEASCRVVVGPNRPGNLPSGVIRTQEQPPGGGPVAAIEAGLAHVANEVLVVLACDMPLITAEVVDELIETLAGFTGSQADGALLRDKQGRRQPLAAAYRSTSLRRALTHLPATGDASMRELVSGLELVEVPAPEGSAVDCDTWESVAACRAELLRRAEQFRRAELLGRAEPRGAQRAPPYRTPPARQPRNAPTQGAVMSLPEWSSELCRALDLDLDVDIKAVLDLARDAAHQVERPAAPLTTFLVGYAAAKRGGSAGDIADCMTTAARLAATHAPAADQAAQPG